MDLRSAISSGDSNAVAQLIANGASVNGALDDDIPLTLAVSSPNINVLRLLIESGADIHARDAFGCQAIHCVADADMAKLLVERGADVNSTSRGGTPLLLNSSIGNEAMVDFLVRSGADPNVSGMYGTTALMKAVMHHHLPVVELLLTVGGDVNKQDDNGSTALMLAVSDVQGNRLPTVKLLLRAGANVNCQRPDGMTALRYACINGAIPVVRELIHWGADVNLVSEYNESALTDVAYQVHGEAKQELMRTLIEAGANAFVRISDQHPDPARRGKSVIELLWSGRDDPVSQMVREMYERAKNEQEGHL